MIAAFMALFLAAPTRADVVTLTNGETMTGIVVHRDSKGLDLQVDADGFITLSSATVSSVEKQSARQNKDITSRWKAERREQAEQGHGDDNFALEQRAKGFIFYQGEWMKPEEARLRQVDKALDSSYSLQRGQVFVAHEAPPSVIHAPQVSNENNRFYHYYFFDSPRRTRVITFQDGKITSSR